jgi:hypothetical protein
MKNVQGYLRSYWTPPLGKYLPRIAPADAMVIDLWPKKSICGVVKSLFKLAFKKHEMDPLLSSSNRQAV